MSLLLHIDTSADRASLCLSEEEEVLDLVFNEARNDHATWLHPAIDRMIKKHGRPLSALEAVSVSIGPGSYTGLRIGLSAAKGICYALNIPLLAISTLKMIAAASVKEASGLVCPLIDARRMEVYAAVYDKQLTEITAPHAMILDKEGFSSLLQGLAHQAEADILFCGNGSPKVPGDFLNHRHIISNIQADASHLVALAADLFRKEDHADTVYTEPVYIKEFYTVKRKD